MPVLTVRTVRALGVRPDCLEPIGATYRPRPVGVSASMSWGQDACVQGQTVPQAYRSGRTVRSDPADYPG